MEVYVNVLKTLRLDDSSLTSQYGKLIEDECIAKKIWWNEDPKYKRKAVKEFQNVFFESFKVAFPKFDAGDATKTKKNIEEFQKLNFKKAAERGQKKMKKAEAFK